MDYIAKFCPNNFPGELQDVKHQLKQHPEVSIVEDQCLNFCGQCIVQPFSIVNGKNITSDTVNELYTKIANHLESLQVKS